MKVRSRRSAHGAEQHRNVHYRLGVPPAPGQPEPARREPIPGIWKRALALVLAGAEVALLVWLAAGPALKVREVSVSGLRHLSRVQVVALAGLEQPGSVLLVDADGIRRKLGRSPWVRSSSVTPGLPDRLLIAIEEWKPVAVYRAGEGGKNFYISSQGAALAPGDPGPGLVEVHGPAGPAELKPGDHPLDVLLLAALVNIQAAMPGILGQEVAAYDLDCIGSLSLTTKKGLKVIFGRVLTPEEFASLNDKLTALQAVAADPDFRKGQVEYVNLVNSLAPAVKFKDVKPSPTPAPSGSPVPAPSPTIQAQTCK